MLFCSTKLLEVPPSCHCDRWMWWMFPFCGGPQWNVSLQTETLSGWSLSCLIHGRWSRLSHSPRKTMDGSKMPMNVTPSTQSTLNMMTCQRVQPPHRPEDVKQSVMRDVASGHVSCVEQKGRSTCSGSLVSLLAHNFELFSLSSGRGA